MEVVAEMGRHDCFLTRLIGRQETGSRRGKRDHVAAAAEAAAAAEHDEEDASVDVAINRMVNFYLTCSLQYPSTDRLRTR